MAGDPSQPQYELATAETVKRFESRLPQMLEELAALTDIESPSSSPEALGACARYLESLGSTLLKHRPERIENEGVTSLVWKFGEVPRVVLVGHYDTVHPLGTVARFPFSVDGDIAHGPGVCDMKGGVIVALHVLYELIDKLGVEALDGLCLFVNGDEEVGSVSSQPLIQELAQTTEYAIGFENAGSDWQLKTERRGCSHYEIAVTGRAAHAGDGSEKGVNALTELCAQAPAVAAIANAERGTSVTPTLATSGTAINTVPEHASMWVDVRARTRSEQIRVDSEVRQLIPTHPEARIGIKGGIEQPPMPATASDELFEMTKQVAIDLNVGEVTSMSVGGAADACKFAAAGAKAIDGFGAVGGDDHSDREWIYTSSLPRQGALAAALVERLLKIR